MEPVTHIPTCTYLNVQDMSIHVPEDYRPCHHHEIYTYRYFYRIQYTPRYKCIAMTSYLLALASIPYIGRCHSALEVESVYTCTSLCDKEMGEPKDS